jgi:predicted nuclease of restriction endonuclease-like (RecB) superfamily
MEGDKMTAKGKAKGDIPDTSGNDFTILENGIAALLETARRQAARSINAILTATYWEIGRRIVEYEQGGRDRAEYGEHLMEHLSADLTARCGRGFSRQNLQQMRQFYLVWQIRQTLSGESAMPAQDTPDYLDTVASSFPLSWSHYVRLLSLQTPEARRFYEAEALRGGWSRRQLERQINSMFYERTALSKNKVAMLTKGAATKPEDAVTAEEESKDPLVLEFLGLKDEYSESDLEEALIQHLETFLLELGNDFTFVARQKRIRVGDEWFRMDLLLYHRRLRCLVIIDLKTDKFTYADAGQMNLYVNYAAEHLTLPEENPPVGLILCSEPNAAVAHYALNGLVNNILAAQYRLALPDTKQLEAELERTRLLLQSSAREKSL